MVKVSWSCTLVVLLTVAVLCASEDAVTVLGIKKSEPIDRSFVFVEGKYVKAPYVVERRGVDIYINNVLIVKGPEWPPYDYRVNEDPGDPPSGTSPIDPVPAGADGRNTYWALKTRYVFQHYDKQAAQQMMLEIYRKCPTFASVDWKPTDPDFVEVKDQTGRARLLELAVDLDYMQAPPSNEQVVESVEISRKCYEGVLSSGDVCLFRFAGAEVIISQDPALRTVSILLSSQTRGDKAKALSAEGISIPSDLAERVVRGFETDTQLLERYDAACKKRDGVVALQSTGA